MDKCNTYFEGIVFSGIGEGGFYVSIYTKKFREKLNIEPYPGTLNIRLRDDQVELFNECLSNLNLIYIEPPAIPNAKLAAVYAYPIELYLNPHITAFIIKPAITIYKNDVIEILSPTYLRKALNLSDGSILKFKLPPHHPHPTSPNEFQPHNKSRHQL
ncbi:MAG: DUF120 domain-containing protein [Acidilobaceae archaeon]